MKKVKLSAQKKKLFDLIESTNEHVFITGRAGTGKSTLLTYLTENTSKQVTRSEYAYDQYGNLVRTTELGDTSISADDRTDVLLLEQGQLTSGTTWHAAGLVGPLRASESGTRLVQYSAELYASRLEELRGRAQRRRQLHHLPLRELQHQVLQRPCLRQVDRLLQHRLHQARLQMCQVRRHLCSPCAVDRGRTHARSRG